MFNVSAYVTISLRVLFVAKNAEKFFLEKPLVRSDGVDVKFFGLGNPSSEEEKRVEIVGFQAFPRVHCNAVIGEFEILIGCKNFDEDVVGVLDPSDFSVTARFLGTD